MVTIKEKTTVVTFVKGVYPIHNHHKVLLKPVFKSLVDGPESGATPTANPAQANIDAARC